MISVCIHLSSVTELWGPMEFSITHPEKSVAIDGCTNVTCGTIVAVIHLVGVDLLLKLSYQPYWFTLYNINRFKCGVT